MMPHSGLMTSSTKIAMPQNCVSRNHFVGKKSRRAYKRASPMFRVSSKGCQRWCKSPWLTWLTWLTCLIVGASDRL